MLEGDLGDFSLPEVLRLLAFTSKSGRLRLTSGNAAGRIDVIDGRVRDASAEARRLPLARRLLGLGVVDGKSLRGLLTEHEGLPTDRELAHDLVTRQIAPAGEVAGVLREQTIDAVFDLLRWTEGSFRFSTGLATSASPPDLAIAVDEVLEEAQRRLDAWDGVRERTGAGSDVVTIGRPTTEVTDVDADGWQLIGFIDGRRSVDELVLLTGRGQFDTRKTLGHLADLGIVGIGAAAGGTAVDQLLTDHRMLADLEDALVRADGAEPAGEEAGRSAGSADLARSADAADRTDQPPTEGTADLVAPVRAAGADDPADTSADTADDAEVAAAAAGTDVQHASADADDTNAVTSLRTRVRSERLKTDPTVDGDLVSRLISGIEGM